MYWLQCATSCWLARLILHRNKLEHMGGWGLRHTPASKELSVRAKILEDGGPKLWSELMDELRHVHLGAPAPKRSVFAKLQSVYEAAITKPQP